jgi:diketogulonate reductase-like aldo/keto reductase
MDRVVPDITLNNGVEMPSIGLGVFQTPPDETRSAVAAALGTGYRHIDTAAAYGNEREVGEAAHASKGGRAAVFLETKIWISDYGYDETLHAFDKSAGKLGVDQIDLLILHQALPSDFGKTLAAYRAIAESHSKSPAQVMLRWHLQEGRSVIPKSTKPRRIAENFDVFDFELTADEVAAIDRLDTGKRGGPEPDAITLESFGREIPEA